MSISSPAKNMIYNKPVFDSSSKLFVDSMMCSECGPIITPARIKPMIPGILKRLNNSGENKMINSVRARIRTGFFNGR
jgi:hypothetical protein